ncbi:MAG: hypothetical protein NVS3B20_06600 [Polyangiales bacterium]
MVWVVVALASPAGLGCTSSDSSPANSDGATVDDSALDTFNDETPGANEGGFDESGDAVVDDAADTAPKPMDASETGTTVGPASVLQHHKSATRDGLYVDSVLTKATASMIKRQATFNALTKGPVYAQPLYLEGEGGNDAVIAVTEQNTVYAFDATTGSVVWQKSMGTPVPLSELPCGNIDPLGITGTPVIDAASRTIFLDAMTKSGGAKKHLIFALSVDDGSVRKGWPIDVSASVKTSGGVAFDSSVQNQRGALLIVSGMLYVPYGGHYGDCGKYYGWVVGVPLTNPTAPVAWATRARGAGIWAPSGLASDGTSIFAATGNGFGSSSWNDGEAIIKLGAGATFTATTSDYFSPTDWKSLDSTDSDLGGTGPLLVTVPGATPSKLAVALGKNGKAYLIDRANLGGVGEALNNKRVSGDQIINAPAAYTTATGTYVVFRGNGIGCPAGQSGNLTAFKITATAPPTINVAWCADQHGLGSPIVTTGAGGTEGVVWSVGAEGDNRLRAFDADTGVVLFKGGGASDSMGLVRRFQTPIVSKGRIFVAADDQVHSFTTK